MSCHSIGRALNCMSQEIFFLYDQGKIEKDAAKKLIKTAQRAVNFCDGNDYEAVEGSYDCRCGNC